MVAKKKKKSSKKKAKKRAKRILAGWKKQDDNFIYYFKPSVAKRFSIKTITFKGFSQQPVGLFLYKTGGGFNQRQVNKVGGSHVLDFLKNKFGKETRLSVFMSGHGSTYFKNQPKYVSLSLSFKDFRELLEDLGTEVKKGRDSVVQERLARFLPNEFKSASSDESANKKLTEINLNTLDKDDHEAVAGFIKRYISINSENDQVLEYLQENLVIEGRKKTLDQVIKKFERHIKNRNFSEKQWQKFLHEEVFFFNSNYIESIREADVNFAKTEEGAKKPDFVWIDLYGFLDVFEIKTPFTEIFARRIDTSHDNYFLSRSSSQAISQIEKYILFLEKNVEGFEKYLQKQTKVPFSVLKPKAFLIIGKTQEWESNDNKKRDFRLLRRSFKNIEFITFDELLDNLKSLSSKFEKLT